MRVAGCSASALLLSLALSSRLVAAAASGADSERYGCGPGHDSYPFCDIQLPLEQRVDDLISRLELDEKPQLLEARFSPLGSNISRLGIPRYDWGGNCIHGVQSRCGLGTDNSSRCPTMFPNPVMLGATFNESVWGSMGSVIGVELRSLWKQGVGENHYPGGLPPIGLDCWSPNINVVRDPRWGRNMETPSEDPLMLARFGVAVTRGVQNGEDDRYLQAVVTLKHFVANELEGTWPGPCPGGKCTRFNIDVNVSAYDLASTFLAPFQASVVEGGALGVMCSYNAVNGVPSCANHWLLQTKLRNEWGFDGYVSSDSGCVEFLYQEHKYVPSMEEAVVQALSAGTDVQSPLWPGGNPWSLRGQYPIWAPKAVREGKLAEQALDDALRHTLRLRFRLGLFDPPAGQPYEHLSPDLVRSAEHEALAVEATEQGLVLLENRELWPGGPRPLPIQGAGKIAIIGPHATSRQAILGNYLGQACGEVTPQGREQFGCVQTFLEAFEELHGNVSYAPGLSSVTSSDLSKVQEAVGKAAAAEHVVVFLGLDESIESEGRDRKETTLPAGQLHLFDALVATGRQVVVVLVNGGAVAMSSVKARAAAIVEAWYPGFYGARAVAMAVLGHTNRWGKLPVTVYDEKWTEEADILSFDMAKYPGRTHRYYAGEPLWPFGHGLSYTTFQVQLLSEPALHVLQGAGSQTLRVQVGNVGTREGDEVLMAFFRPAPGTLPAGCRAQALRQQLFNFRRVALSMGAKTVVEFPVSSTHLAVYTDKGDKVSYSGWYEVWLSNGHAELPVAVHVDSAANSEQPVLLEAWEPSLAEAPMAARPVGGASFVV